MAEFLFDTVRTITSLLWSGPSVGFPISDSSSHMKVAPWRRFILESSLLAPNECVPEGAEAALARLYADTASLTAPAPFAGERQWLSPDPLLFATDYPWADPSAFLTALADLPIDAILLRKIKGDNALALFGKWSGEVRRSLKRPE